MTQFPVKTGHPSASPLDSLRSGVRHRELSAEGRWAWAAIWRAMVLTFLSLVCSTFLPGVWRNVLGGGLAVAAAVFVLRLRWRHISRRRFWRWAFGIGLLMLLTPWEPITVGGRVVLSVLLFVLLVFRSWSFLPALGSRRRALTWLGGSVLVMLSIAGGGPAEASHSLTRVLHHVFGLARFTLVVFWVMSAVWIFLGVRLHFLRLRPKLAVAGLLLTAVPVGLILTLGLIGGYSMLGVSRAGHAAATLDHWLHSSGGSDSQVFVEGFGDVDLPEGQDPVEPAWLVEVRDAIAHSAWDPMPPSIWFTRAGELWALQIDDSGPVPDLVGGRRLDRSGIQQLARETGCVVGLLSGSDSGAQVVLGADTFFVLGALAQSGLVIGDGVVADTGDSTALLLAWPEGVTREEVDGTAEGISWTRDVFWFGASAFERWHLGEDGLSRGDAVLALNTRPRDLAGLLVQGDSDLNSAILGVIAAIAILFLAFELLALYFGVRIVGGVTGAVGQLHRVTERLAQGDLDASIELPNEDEFGDLASSFNEMTTAIRVAQDQIVQKQLLEAQLDTARGIQQRLLPASMPQVAGYEISGSSDPSLQVSGDYFDFVEMSDGRLGIAVADVTGKGVPAALLMANVQAGLHGQILHPGSAAEIIARMNDLMYESTDPHMFVTFALILLDPATGRVESVSAGHEPTLLIRLDGSVEKFEAGGLMLGMMPGFEYMEDTGQLDPGDVLVMYTDGVTEAMGPAPKPVPALPGGRETDVEEPDEEDDEAILPFFEENRLIDLCVARRHESAEEIRRALLASIRGFAANIPQSDDITIVVVKREALD